MMRARFVIFFSAALASCGKEEANRPDGPRGFEAGLPHADGKTGTDQSGPQPDRGTGPWPDSGTPPAAPPCDAALEKGACGGALTGKYVYKEACASSEVVAPLAAVCPGVTVQNVKAVNNGGTLTFNGPTYVLQSSTNVALDIQVPPVCAVMGCQGVQTAIAAALTTSGASAPKATCTGTAVTGCSCAITWTVNTSDAGAFTTSGGVVTLVGGAQYWYCVKPNGLLYKGKANTGDVGIAYALGR